MQPRRPDSAKSRVTQKTLDTQLNQSKFSQTFTSYTTLGSQKKDEFLQYLQEKEKDPKFKKYNVAVLPEIPEKVPNRQELAKINSKPFEKRTSKVNPSSGKKPQQKPTQPNPLDSSQVSITSTTSNYSTSNNKWTVNQPNTTNNNNAISVTKKEPKVQFNSTSKSFAEKNKQKMNSITAGLNLKKVEDSNTKKGENGTGGKRIELKGFKVNVPGKTRDNKTNQGQKQVDINGNNNSNNNTDNHNEFLTPTPIPRPITSSRLPPQKTPQQLARQHQLLQISRFINQVQTKNIDYYPEGYEEFVEMNESRVVGDLERIDINDFLVEPTERDYEKVQRRIRENQRRLVGENSGDNNRAENGSISNNNSTYSNNTTTNPITDQSSIDLDRLIDGDSSQQQQSELHQQQTEQNEIFLSSISSRDLHQRNLFLTQILKGRVTQQEITKLQQMDRSHIKLRKLQDQKQDQQDDLEIMEINMMKKKSNRLFERNMVEASGQVYRDCDYLSEENKLRLERLLEGEMDESPFQVTEMQRFAIRRIDEGIKLYRELSSSSYDANIVIIPEELLPKDPILRKQAERKILKEKIDSINSRLHQIQNIVITQSKIQSLIQLHRTPTPSLHTQSLISQRQRQLSQLQEKNQLALQMLTKAQQEKSSIQSTLKEMQEEYQQYEKECKEFEKLTVEEIRQRERVEVGQQKKRVEEIMKSLEEIETGTQEAMGRWNAEMEREIGILREIENLGVSSVMVYQGLVGLEDNVEGIDAQFEKRASQDPEVVEMKKRLDKEGENEKENENITA